MSFLKKIGSVKGTVKKRMSLSSSSRSDRSSKSEGEELEKLGITRKSSICHEEEGLISYHDCVLRYYQFMGCSIKKIKKLIPRGWQKSKNIDHVTIGQVNDLSFRIFYLKCNNNMFWPKNEFDRDETYLILSGNCKIQLGEDIKDYKQGDFIHVKSNIVHGVTTGKKDEVVIGYVHHKAKGLM